MTIGIVIKCTDIFSPNQSSTGLVVAADSMLSSGTQYSVPVNKISVHANNTIMTYSGDLGIGQELGMVIDQNPDSGNYKDFRTYPTIISKQMITYLKKAMPVTPWDPYFANSRISPWDISAIMGYVNKNEINACKFKNHLRPSFITGGKFYDAIGSGTYTARPFLQWNLTKLLKSLIPKVIDSSFLAHWTIRHTIETSGGGVGWPIRIYEIRRNTAGGILIRSLSWQQIRALNKHASVLEDKYEESLKNYLVQELNLPAV